MGFAMASNLRKNMPPGSTLYVYDVYRPSCDRFVSENKKLGEIVIADTVADAAARSKFVVSIVPTADNVSSVYLDKTSGLVAAVADPDRLIIECSTIESATAREIGEALEASQHGCYVDAPVSVCRI